jgi:molybdopterin-guanine dinucleotide biosynthesis protein A
MGGVDKALLMLGGETLIARAVARARPQVSELVINANGDPARFAEFGLPVIPDRVAGFQGPLAGVLAGLDWLRANRPEAKWLATFACDCPFFPLHLVERLLAAAERENVPVAIAIDKERNHPVFAVWHADLPVTSESVLNSQDSRKMDHFVARFPNAKALFQWRPDPFFNANTPEDLVEAERMGAMNAQTRAEWRELGFFYDRNDEQWEWRIAGSKAGLEAFAATLQNYAANPNNAVISEHEHLGPYSYLKIGTSHEPDISKQGIAGPLDSLRILAQALQQSVLASKAGDILKFRDKYAPTAPYELTLEVREDDFDPASADECCW